MSGEQTDEQTGMGQLSRREVLKTVAGAGAVSTGYVETDRVRGAGSYRRYVVGIDPDSRGVETALAAARTDALSVHREIDLGDVRYLVAGQYTQSQRERLQSHTAVAYVEPDLLRDRHRPVLEQAEPTASGTYPWGIERIGAHTAHENGNTGSGVDIVIIDTGTEPTHQSLSKSIGGGNVFGDAACVETDRAYQSVTCSENWDDDYYHGTHVAGSAGAVDRALTDEKNPSVDIDRIAGVAPEATLHVANVFEWFKRNGEWVPLAPSSNTADALRWAVDQEYDVANASLGGSSPSTAIRDALDYAVNENNLVFVASAGNDGNSCEEDDCVSYPAAFDEAIAVANATKDDEINDSSSRGPEVEVAAPGTAVLSAVPPHLKQDSTVDSDHWWLTGTSMASPHVAGLAAVIKSSTDLSENTEIRKRIRQTTENIGASEVESGNGLIDVEASLGQSQSALAVSTTGATDVSRSEATLKGKLTNLGEASSVDVSFEYRTQGSTAWKQTDSSTMSATGSFTKTVTGLTAGTTYEFRAVGKTNNSSATGNSKTFTTTDPNLTVLTGDATSVSQTGVTLDGELTGLGGKATVDVYFAYRKQGDSTWTETEPVTVQSPQTFQTDVSGLTAGTTYEYQAIAATDSNFTTGQIKSFSTDDPPLGVSTVGSTDVSREEATFQGKLTSLGGETQVTIGFQYRKQGETSWQQTGGPTVSTTGVFQLTARGLSPGTVYEFRALVTAGERSATGQSRTFTTRDPPLAVSTTGTTNVSETSLTLEGTLTSLGGESNADVFFEYRTQGSSNWLQTGVSTVTETGSFEQTLTDLSPATTYEFRALATAGGESASGSVRTETTSTPPVSVSTTGTGTVGAKTATLTGTLTSLGGRSSVEVAFQYRTQGTESWQQTESETRDSTGSFDRELTGLATETSYEFRAIALPDGTTVTGATKTFTTTAPSLAVSTTEATGITQTEATLTGKLTSLGSASSVEVAFQYRTQGTQRWQQTETTTQSSPGSFEQTLTGLDAGTTYEFRAMATTDSQSVTGAIKRLTTSSSPVAVRTDGTVGVSKTETTVQGTLTSLGSASSVDVGFEYRQTGGSEWTQTSLSARQSPGSFTSTLTGLQTGTTYEFRAVASTDSSPKTGSVQTVTPSESPLSVSTTGTQSVSKTELTLKGKLTSLGSTSSVEAGFEYRKQGTQRWQQTATATKTATGTFTETAAGLETGTTYEFRAVATAGNTTMLGETKRASTSGSATPAVSTTGTKRVTDTEATLEGKLTSLGSASSVEVAFEYRQKGDQNWQDTESTARQSTGTFTSTVTGLKAETTYEFRAIATTGSQSVTGTTETFTTVVPLEITTEQPTGVRQTEATFVATLETLGGAKTVDVSFEYERKTGGKTDRTETQSVSTTGAVELTVTGLEPGTTYVYSAIGETAQKSASGSEVEFTTSPPLGVTTHSPTAVTQTRATFRGELTNTGGADTIAASFEYQKENGGESTETLAKTLDSAGSYEIEVTDLDPETVYRVTALAESETDSDRGDRERFTTRSPPLDVKTTGVSGIGMRKATISGTLTELGGAESGQVYFEYWAEGEEPPAETSRESVTGSGTFTRELTGLEPGTTYHVYAAATTTEEEATGETETFRTEPLPLTVETGEATDVSQTTATLNGEITQLGGAEVATLSFEYWPVLAQTREETDRQITKQPTSVQTEVTELKQNTAYEFQLTARTDTATTTGEVSEFTTPVEPVSLKTADTTRAATATFSKWGEGYRIEAPGETPWDRPQNRHGYGAVYETTSSDIVVQTTIEGLYGEHDTRMAGVVISDDITAGGGTSGDLLVAFEPDAGVSVVTYSETDRKYERRATVDATLPVDLRITRDGSTYTTQIRNSTATEWQSVGTVSVTDTAESRDVGLFATGGDENDPATADFSDYRMGETAVSLLPSEWELGPLQTAQFDLVVENAKQGISSYTVELAVTDLDVIEIDGLSPTGKPAFESVEIAKDGSRGELEVGMGSNAHPPGDVTIATVTIQSNAEGTASVTIPEVSVVNDSQNVPYEIATTQPTTVTVEESSGPPPIVGDRPPQDLNGDGLYRDINGDGQFSIADVQVFFEHYRDDVVQNNAEYFNFDGRDPPDVSVADLQALFDDLVEK